MDEDYFEGLNCAGNTIPKCKCILTDQKLDRIIELLEERTNPPNPAWPYPPTTPSDKVGWPVSPSPTCDDNPAIGPNTYTSSYNENPRRFWSRHGVELMPGTEEYNQCKAIYDSCNSSW